MFRYQHPILTVWLAGVVCLAFGVHVGVSAAIGGEKPNFVLCMADDQGWGDVGYNGHPHLKTPVLDEMAASGLRLNRFYAGAPVCSPTRGSFMTGRHPSRYGCFLYNFSLRPEEITLGEAAKLAGYTTGHFGKWHLGPVKAGNPLSPKAQGFDEYLSHDNFFDNNPSLSRNGEEPQQIQGESSEVVVDAALQFIGKAVKNEQPFLTVVWFGSPHSPHKATAKDKGLYQEHGRAADYYGEITAMDRAMGKLRQGLREMGVTENTFLLFCSDNGPAGPGSSGGLSGKKGSISEGGIRVPGIIQWPAKIREPRATEIPCGTIDIYPTVLDILGLSVPNQVQPLDGISILPLIEGTWTKRPKPMAFGNVSATGSGEPYVDPIHLKGWWRTFKNQRFKQPLSHSDGQRGALIDNQYKLFNGKLYDLSVDPQEKTDISSAKPDVAKRMADLLAEWQLSVSRSLCGQDYR